MTTRTKRGQQVGRVVAVAVVGAFMAVARLAAGATTPSGTPQSSIPSDSGAIKAGDVIIWKGVRTVTLQSDSTAQQSTSAPAAPSVGAGSPNVADVAAAAKALAQAAHDLLDAAGPAPNPTDPKFQAFAATAVVMLTADNAANQAVATARAAGTSIVATQAGTQAAAVASVGKASSDLSSAANASDKLKAQILLAAATNALKTLSNAPQTAAAPKADTVCFPPDSRFNVTSVVAATKSNSTPTGSATVSDTQIVSGKFSSDGAFEVVHLRHIWAIPGVRPPKRGETTAQNPSTSSPCGAVSMPVYDKTYEFSSDTLKDGNFYRQGFTWGGLVVPYKYYFSDHSMKSNTSVVGFVGYEGWFPGISLAGVVALGPGTAPTSTTTSQGGGGTSTTSSGASVTAVTYTAALGLIVSFGDSQTVKLGLMFGRDYESNASSFPYENKTWMALSIGAGF